MVKCNYFWYIIFSADIFYEEIEALEAENI
jgi:hypothetical protein